MTASPEQKVHEGIAAFHDMERNLDGCRAELSRMQIENARLLGANDALREGTVRLMERVEVLTAALATANAHIKINHHCYVDLAHATDKAIRAAAETQPLTLDREQSEPELSEEAQEIAQSIAQKLSQSQQPQPRPVRFMPPNLAAGVARRPAAE